MNTVLVVDQSAPSRQALGNILEALGLRVIETGDGLEACDLIANHHPDLVITDIVIPSMNGYELCCWLKNNPNFQQIPIMICTSKDSEFDRFWGLSKGANAYIVKPFWAEEMIGIIQELLPQTSQQPSLKKTSFSSGTMALAIA